MNSETPTAGHRSVDSAPQRSGWVGWVWFAGSLLLLVGAFNIIVGLVALLDGTVLVAGAAGALLFDLTGWGWVHLLVGVLLLLVGGGLFTGSTAARVTAVVLAGLNAIAQLAFLPVYPAWSLLIIALDVVILWAILVHGGEVEAP